MPQIAVHQPAFDPLNVSGVSRAGQTEATHCPRWGRTSRGTFHSEHAIMLAHRRSRFESLEKRLALTVTATVSAGDLLVQGDADGAVAITSVGSGAFEVRDNG